MNVKQQAIPFTVQDASRIASELYDLQATASQLPGELDYNFYLKTKTGQEFVLKIAPTGTARENLDLQNKALEHLRLNDPTLILPQVYPTSGGESIATLTTADAATYFVRLLTYIPGQLFAETNPHTPELLHSLGSLLGRLDRNLQSFSHTAAQRTLKWDLRHALWIREYLEHIVLPERRTLVEHYLTQFENVVLPVLPSLRKSIIHNDGNDYNILVRKSPPTTSEVISLIDFGDMVETNTICELAIAASYAMMGKADPLAAAAAIVAGYHMVYPLTEAELEVLFPLICIRLSISVVNSAYQQQIEPENQYLTISELPAWALLEKLMQIHPRFAHYTFRQACQLPAHPDTPRIIEWLAGHANQCGRVVEPDLRATKTVVFDLSIGSLELGNLATIATIEAFNRHIFERLKAEQTTVGIGRYNEARPIYTSDQYKIASNNGPEWRTIHVGLDVFMKAGSPIFAPLDGVVHSFCNNDAPLDYGPTIILQHTLPDQQLTFYTLYGHLSLDSLDGLTEGMPVSRGMAFAKIGDHLVNGGWPPHLHFQIITDLLDRKGEFPGVARPSQRETWLSLSPDPNLIVGIPEERFPMVERNLEQILQVRTRHIGKSLSISYKKPLKIVRGSMQYLYDENGRAYLDAVNNVSHVGHSHPRVVKAGQEQMAVLNTNTRYLHDNLVRYAERLCATLPEPLSVCYFVCSGSEANELALRLARAYSQRKDIVVMDAGYHGNTSTLVEISSYKFDGPGGTGAPPYVHKVPMPDLYRGPYRGTDIDRAQQYAYFIKEAIQNAPREIGAFICESILSCGGQLVLPDNYLKEVYQHIHNAGGVCIADEVQVGFGRVGSHFWGFETQGVVPDIVTMGKSIGNGHPLAAVVTTPEIADAFNNGMEYFNTFGGNPVSCAIGLAVLDVISDEQLQAKALRVGTHLMTGLNSLKEKHPLIGDVRGLGLFVGLELVLDHETLAPAATQATYIANRMRDHGILLSTDGPLHNVLKIKPPMVINETNMDFLVATLDKILAEDFAQA